jgi:PAS domain S-box-containing protein
MKNAQSNAHFKNLADESFAKIYRQADRFNEYILFFYLLFGIGLAFFYDTWKFALAVGPLAILIYFVSKWVFGQSKLRQHIAGISYGIFMAQFIYQMHGLFEMHFTVFIAAVALISYRNWKVFIPFTLFVVVHHGLFAYLQYSGFPEIRFTQEEFMPLTAFIFHIVLAAIIIGLAAYRAYDFKRFTLEVIKQESELKKKAEQAQTNISIASSIAAGKETDHTVDEDDVLGHALMDMQGKLKEAREREEIEKYINLGLAEVGDLLRKNTDSLEQLSEQIIGYLVKYLKANQSAIFVLKNDESEDEKVILELTGCYAYGKKKHMHRQVEAGQGLVGQVFLEKETMLLTDVPDQYVKITSGLGEATASCITLVPLKVNEDVQGVIEIASFEVLRDYQITLLEKVSESIASAVANGKVNQRTQRLLEQSRQQTEELRAQEEEMRQNNEEMQATQEEMIRKETELSGFVDAINNTFASIEFDTKGYILKANQTFAETMGYEREELVGQHHRIFVSSQLAKSKEYQDFWSDLENGKALRQDILRYTKEGKPIWLYASYTPLFDQQGRVFKILKLAQDISVRKSEEEKVKRLSLVADNTDNSVVITNSDGLIEYVNEGFCRLTGYTLEEVKGKKPGSMLQGEDTSQETKKRISEKLRKRESFYEEILNYNKFGESYWISLAINPVFDSQGKLEKFIAIQANITETKSEAIDYACKMDAISRSSTIVEFDMEGNILTANNSYAETLGYTLNEIKGMHHSQFVEKSYAQSEEYQRIWKTLQTGESVVGDFPRVDKQGNEIWFRGSFNVVEDINGKPFKIVKIAQDITQVKLLELEAGQRAEELRENEKKLRKYTGELEELQTNLSKKLQEAKNEMKDQLEQLEAEKLKNTAILEGCVDGVISFNDRGTIEFFNQAAEEIWKVKRDEIVGRNVNELMSIEFSQAQDGRINVLHYDEEMDVKTQITIRTEINVKDREGEEVSILLTCSPATAMGRHFYTLFIQKISVDLF